MTSQMISVSYGSHSFEVQLEYRDRKTLSISVLPDCSIVALAPRWAAASDIGNRLRRRAGWIKRQPDYFDQFNRSHRRVSLLQARRISMLAGSID